MAALQAMVGNCWPQKVEHALAQGPSSAISQQLPFFLPCLPCSLNLSCSYESNPHHHDLHHQLTNIEQGAMELLPGTCCGDL